MSIKEQVTQALDHLDDAELQKVATYVEFLALRGRRGATMSDDHLAAMYAEFADEDRVLAEEGIMDASTMLQAEDAA